MPVLIEITAKTPAALCAARAPSPGINKSWKRPWLTIRLGRTDQDLAMLKES
jgi:hypothetical protein